MLKLGKKSVSKMTAMFMHLLERQLIALKKWQDWKTLYSIKAAHAVIMRAKI